PRPGPRPRGPRPLRRPHRAREPPARSAQPAPERGRRARPLPGAAAAPRPQGRPALRWRAADARHGPRPGRRPQGPARRRDEHGAGAPHRGAPARHARRAGPGLGLRCPPRRAARPAGPRHRRPGLRPRSRHDRPPGTRRRPASGGGRARGELPGRRRGGRVTPRVGVVVPQNEIGTDPGQILAWAKAVESEGFHHLDVFDHVLGADVSGRPDWPGPYTHEHRFHEPLVLYGYLAGHVELELATGVLVLPQRQTALVAKQVAELDVLSGGRVRLGVGIGWNPVEYES